jgi:predicted metal-dependent hydrolase
MQLHLPLSDASASASDDAADAAPALVVVPASASPQPWSVTFVRRRRARRYILRVDPEGRVRVTIPRGGSKREADAFVERNRPWIERQRAGVRPPSISVVERHAWQQRAGVELPPLLLARAQALGLPVARVSIRNQRTRWGSCGRDGHITLNWRLLLMPDWVADYVIVHELMHLRRLDHSPAFWKLVAAAHPRYREARQWLRSNAESLR